MLAYVTTYNNKDVSIAIVNLLINILKVGYTQM